MHIIDIQVSYMMLDTYADHKLLPFFVFQHTAVQFTTLFLFRIVDNILQTISVVKNSAAAAMREDMAVSDRFK